MDQSRKPAVFFDKDGTLIVNEPYNVDPALIRLNEGALEAAARVAAAGFELVIVSNQSGVARGMFPVAALADVERRVTELLAEGAVRLAGFYYCPHHPQGVVREFAYECSCRKPRPGMLQRAAEELRLDLARSWMIGDILDDVEAGQRAGCRTILLNNGGETLWERGPERAPTHTVATLLDAAEIIVAAAQHTPHHAQRSLHHV
jgi:histidinol-phosphate phosphatase family protein